MMPVKKAPPIEVFQEAAAKGMTQSEFAKAHRLSRTSVSYYATQYRIAFAKAERPFFRAKPGESGPMRDLTPQERTDVRLLMREAGYTMAEAISVVRRPKTVVRAPRLTPDGRIV